jgi:hypothetical protein
MNEIPIQINKVWNAKNNREREREKNVKNKNFFKSLVTNHKKAKEKRNYNFI